MKKISKEVFLERCKEIWGNIIDYSKIDFKSISSLMLFGCKKHNVWYTQKGTRHLEGRVGCYLCGKIYKHTIDTFKEISTDKHQGKYDYSLVVYKSNKDKVKIVCPIHGQFEQTPEHHMKGFGCWKCSGCYPSTSIDFIKKARDVHGSTYVYSKSIYKNNKTPICVICPKHGPFYQIPQDHLKGHGCFRCSNSQGERKIKDVLDQMKIKYIQEKRFQDCRNPKTDRTLPFDFYIPSRNLCIEYDGPHHFLVCSWRNWSSTSNLRQTKKRDKLKTQYCKTRNIKLIRITYQEYSQIELILKSIL